METPEWKEGDHEANMEDILRKAELAELGDKTSAKKLVLGGGITEPLD